MNEYLRLKKSNCKNCYKCIRQCPVKSIKFQDNQAHIVEDECILCGQCFVVCPQNAKEIRNDTDAVKKLISTGRPVYASVAPSFVANYPPAYTQILSAGAVLPCAGAVAHAGALQKPQRASRGLCGGVYRTLHIKEGRSGAISRNSGLRADL